MIREPVLSVSEWRKEGRAAPVVKGESCPCGEGEVGEPVLSVPELLIVCECLEDGGEEREVKSCQHWKLARHYLLRAHTKRV